MEIKDPEEKAQEIINKIREVVESRPMTISYENARQIAIKSALICIDEILEQEKITKAIVCWTTSESYWRLVKDEIKKLKIGFK